MQPNTNFWRYRIRPFKWDDLYALQALINVVARHEKDSYYYNLEWLHFVLNQPHVDTGRTCFVAQLDNDRIVGYSRVEASEDVSCRKVFAGVHPKFRAIGVGRALIAANDFNLMSIQPVDTPLTVVRQSPPDNRVCADLLSRRGYVQTLVDDKDYLWWEKQLC